MSYMNCPRCGLSIRIRATVLSPDCCPRCVVRAGAVIPMVCFDDRPAAPAIAEANSLTAGRIVEPVTPATTAESWPERNSQRMARPAAPSPVPESKREAVQLDGSRSSPPLGRVTASGPLSPTAEELSLAEGPTPTPLDHHFINEWS